MGIAVKIRRIVLATVLVMSAASVAQAKPKIQISITQAKAVPVKPGSKSTKMVPTKTALPGETLEYTLTYTNKGDESAMNAVVQDQIPTGMTYVENSAAGEGAEMTFSNDGGKTYAPATTLTFEMKDPTGKIEKRVVTPSEYTNIRWTIKEVHAGATGKVSFQAKVK